MNRFSLILISAVMMHCAAIATTAYPDSTKIWVNLLGQSFFDNKEFTGNIKKGYTHPGFWIKPSVDIKTDRFYVDAGLHLLYLAGADSVDRLVPALSLLFRINNNISLVAGTLNTRHGHYLSEPLYKPERLSLKQPETGVQFFYKSSSAIADLWINWERYIKTGSQFQEEFTVGFSHVYNPYNIKAGFSNSMASMAFHKGGQIDSTDLPVQTLINVAEMPAYSFAIGSGQLLGISPSFYFYKNLSPSINLKFNRGYAFHTKVFVTYNNLYLELGQWLSNGFVNPRGEELYGSFSTISPEFDQKRRSLTTLLIQYEKIISNAFTIHANTRAYYDSHNKLMEYSYTLILTFDSEVMGIKKR